jgi:hypothetical protein
MADIMKRLRQRLDRPAIGFGYAVRNDIQDAMEEIERLRTSLRALDALITEDPQQIEQAGRMRELIAGALISAGSWSDSDGPFPPLRART